MKKLIQTATAALMLLAVPFLAPKTLPVPQLVTKAHAAGAGRLSAIQRLNGLHERKNNKTLRKVLGLNPARTPWCGAAVSYAVKRSGGRPPKGANRAISWSRYGSGVSLKNARKGDIVVFRNKRGHHVAIFKGRAKNGRVIACGGNMSNRVKCSNYRPGSVVAVRR